jgi:hypothetical protein
MEGEPLLRAVERRLDDLREADREAVRVATRGLELRMAGFPEEFARKAELVAAAAILQRVESGKLDKSAFDTFVETYRVEQDRADDARRELATSVRAAADAFRLQIVEERGNYISEENYSQRHRLLQAQVESNSRWQYKIVGGLIFATFIAPVLSALLVYQLTT